MALFHLIVAVVAAIALFLYGLQGFSYQLKTVGADTLRHWLGKFTANRWAAFGVGAVSTAILQSSSAVTSLTVALVDASVISFRASLGVLLGANVGTTATAWLVSFKMTGLGLILIALGALLQLLPARHGRIGKVVFYFGMIFFALDLISKAMLPLGQMPAVLEFLALAETPVIGVLAGLVITAILQSSSVTTGLAIVLVQQGLLPPQAAIAITIGANIGTTSTALIASVGMNALARKTARYNLLFNTLGVLLLLPFIGVFSTWLTQHISDTGQAVAAAHLLFNLGMSLTFLLCLNSLLNLVERNRHFNPIQPLA
ncbi:Na/Pi cotransporter family protein [Deefgea salmonis]|uniref:Na/Pi symporter n=1 Tax=Deefgea salmonis TaxID=2875502 RepID=A0ABS8BNZ4_9NEIS|nr:Na/Pi symporter [Deefgea salmonis]MCB5197458.1 Na/Pi symporter [Deefgea salmonis]